MPRSLLRIAVAAAATVLTSASMLEAQAGYRRAAAPPDIEPRAPIVVSGLPRSFQIVSITIPAEMTAAAGAVVEVVPRGDFIVLAPTRRSLSSLRGRGAFTATIGIPANAGSGRLPAAEARFSAPGRPPIVIPIEIDVQLVRDVILRLRQRELRARAGGELLLPFEIINTGNSIETLRVLLELPRGWSGRYDRDVVVGPGGSHEGVATVRVPATAGSGTFFFQIAARDSAVTRQEIPGRVQVLGAGTAAPGGGPQVTTSVATVSDGQSAARSYGIRVRGPLFDDVRIDARYSHAERAGTASLRTLSRLGAYSELPSLSLIFPGGRFGLGAAGTTFSEISGLYPSGRGAVLELNTERYGVTALAARPVRRTGPEKVRPLLGIRSYLRAGLVRVVATLTQLTDQEGAGRKLNAAAIGASVPGPSSSTLRGEIATRRHATGAGIGWTGEFIRNVAENMAQLRVSHAPGGSQAFARAADELLATIHHQVSRRFAMSGSAWRQADTRAGGADLESRGIAIRPQFSLGRSTTVAVDLRNSAVDVENAPSPGGIAEFGRVERQTGVLVGSAFGAFRVRAAAHAGYEIRTVTVTDRTPVAERVPRVSWTGEAAWRRGGSSAGIQGKFDQRRERSGLVREQGYLTVRGERLLSSGAVNGVRVEAEARHLWGFGPDRLIAVSGGVRAPLPGPFEIRLTAERDPLYRRADGRVPIIFGVRVEQSGGLPMLRPPGSSGQVYRDLNGNRRRDDGEPGVSGVVLRRNGHIAVTDASGSYRLAGREGQRILLDESSLPMGWAPTLTNGADFAIAVESVAEVRFLIAPRSDLVTVDVDLARANVVARDASGREWLARMTDRQTATFESLPAGTYTLELDFSALAEPLVARPPVPPLMVRAGERVSLTVILDPRPLRMWRAEPRASDGTQ